MERYTDAEIREVWMDYHYDEYSEEYEYGWWLVDEEPSIVADIRGIATKMLADGIAENKDDAIWQAVVVVAQAN